MRNILTISMTVILFARFVYGQDSALEKSTLGHLNSTDVFYDATHYTADEVRDALEEECNSIQFFLGRRGAHVNAELYDGSAFLDPKSKAVKLKGFYDFDTDTIFVNIDKLNIRRGYAYVKYVNKLGFLRYDKTNKNPVNTPSEKFVEENKKRDRNSLDFEIHMRRMFDQKNGVSMSKWLKEYRGAKTVILGTAKAENVKNPIEIE